MYFVSRTIIGVLLIVSIAERALSHGEDRPGPHGGNLQMPGNFHTELVVTSKTSFRVYLLDGEFKNPITSESSVVGNVVRAGKKVGIKCSAEKVYFQCRLDSKNTGLRKKDKIILKVNRNRVNGTSVYRFPLKYKQR